MTQVCNTRIGLPVSTNISVPNGSYDRISYVTACGSTGTTGQVPVIVYPNFDDMDTTAEEGEARCGKISFTPTAGSRNIGHCAIYDTGALTDYTVANPATVWTPVTSTSRTFVGACVFENGLIRLVAFANDYLKVYLFDGTAWTYCGSLTELESTREKLNYNSIISNSPEKIIISVKSAYSAKEIQTTLRRGSYFADFYAPVAFTSQFTMFSNTADGRLIFYENTVKDLIPETSVLGTLSTDNWDVRYRKNRNFLEIYATTTKISAYDDAGSTAYDYSVVGGLSGSRTRWFFGVVPYNNAYTLLKSSEATPSADLTTFSDGFESGDFATGGWTAGTAWGTVPSTTSPITGTYSAYGDGSLAPSSAISKSFSSPYPQILEVESTVKFAEANMNHIALLCLPQTGEVDFLLAYSDGHFKTNYGSGFVNLPVDTTYLGDSSTEYQIKVRIDCQSAKYWIWIDGNLKTPDGLIPKTTGNVAVDYIKSVAFYPQSGTGTGRMWLDDIKYTLYPATLDAQNEELAWNVNSGLVARDTSLEGHNDGIINGATYVAGQSAGTYALQFDGVDDYVDCGRNSNLDSLSAVSCEAWVKFDAVPTATQTIISKGKQSTNNYVWMYYAPATSRFYFEVGNGTTRVGAYKTTTITPNTWYHVVGTYSSGHQFCYVDSVAGAEQTALTGSVGSSPTYDLVLGVYSDGKNVYLLDGAEDGARIYANRVLTSTEVAQHYAGTFSDETGLVGKWDFEETGGEKAIANPMGNYRLHYRTSASKTGLTGALDYEILNTTDSTTVFSGTAMTPSLTETDYGEAFTIASDDENDHLKVRFWKATTNTQTVSAEDFNSGTLGTAISLANANLGATVSVEPDGGGTPFVEGTDYTLNRYEGKIVCKTTGSMVASTVYEIDYTYEPRVYLNHVDIVPISRTASTQSTNDVFPQDLSHAVLKDVRSNFGVVS